MTNCDLLTNQGWVGASSAQRSPTYSYGSAGGIITTDASGDTSSALANDDGMVAQVIDALGSVTQFRYDDSMNLT